MGNSKDGEVLNTGTKKGDVLKGLLEMYDKERPGAGAMTFSFDYDKATYPSMPETNASKYEKMQFKNGNYKLPDDIKLGALNLADELIAYAKKNNIDLNQSDLTDAGKLDGKPGITREEVAAYVLAKSMANSTRIGSSIKDIFTTFDNVLDRYEIVPEEDHSIVKATPEVIAAIGKQILGDNFDKSLKTDTPEADKEFVKDMSTKDLLRIR